ncbi:TIGR03086 family metal-binding protein [Micromonospora sp. NPDC047707]|uniref:TIGR03086 family metal-binding protein n=1 Tax=Micromonospora sp. NPDC047707 TaxID=3154498 RepID=UPI0034519640
MSDITLQISIDADPAAVHQAVATADGIAGWFTDRAEVTGDTQHLTFPGYPGPAWQFKVTEDGAERVAMTVVAGPPNWIGTEIVYVIEGTPKGTELRFAHNGFADGDAAFAMVQQTWTELMDILKGYAETGAAAPKFIAENPIAELARVFAETLRAMPADLLQAPTPCREFTVSQLLGHLAPVLANSARAARKLPLSQEPVDASPEAVAEFALQAATAWGEPGALEGTTQFGPGEMPAAFASAITLQELALHGWDLARATGREVVVTATAAEAVLAIVEQIGEQARATGGYGPALPAPAGAGTFERALAASGRDARWGA